MTEGRRRGELTRVGDLVDVVLGRIAKGNIAPIVDLRRNWDAVAGEWAGRCRPVAIADGVLTVEVSSGMDATVLRFGSQALAESVRRHLGGAVPIRRIAIRVRAVGGDGR